MEEQAEIVQFDFQSRSSDGESGGLVLNIAGFEGPLDVLLMLARAQKVDLTHISILELVEQYLEFIQEVRRLNIEIAADYLVMAAWLAYLKSRLLLPRQEDDEEPSAEELATRLQLRLQRLGAMREMGARLINRDRLGRDVFPRGAPEPIRLDRQVAIDASLFELLQAYGDLRLRRSVTSIRFDPRPVYAIEDAIERLEALIGRAVDWTWLQDFMPEGSLEGGMQRSAMASMFAASLEIARQGRADIRQNEPFGPLYLKSRREQGKAAD